MDWNFYKFGRNRGNILQKCNIDFLNQKRLGGQAAQTKKAFQIFSTRLFRWLNLSRGALAGFS